MPRGNRKGSSFERDFCSDLSQWLTRDKRDDVFWRTAGSGGRATGRRKTHGISTAGGGGDIHEVDPIGKPLMEMFTFELKRGYNKVNVQDLIDRPDRQAQCELESWVQQAKESADGNSQWWIIVHKRDQREPIVLFPSEFSRWLSDIPQVVKPTQWHPFFRIRCYYRRGTKADTKEFLEVDGTTLSEFFRQVRPSVVETFKRGY